MTQNYPPNPNQPYPPQQGYQQGPPPGYAPPPQGYQQGPPRVAPQGSPYPVLVSTMNDLPGYTAEQVFGLTVRSRDFGSNFTASFRSLGGGEVPEYTQMLAESRHVAVMRMCQMAQQLGANAILAMRFDCNEIAQTMSEVAAYGTAVIVRKVEPPRVQDTKPDEDDAHDS